MTKPNPRFDAYFERSRQWHAEFKALRAILLDCGLDEELKWRQPCYTFEGANIVIFSGTKPFCALGFFKGSLMADPLKLLQAPGPNSRAARMLRFTSLAEIQEKTVTIKAYVREALRVETQGLKVDFSPNKTITLPLELLAQFNTSAPLKTAWDALTTGRQRGWALQFDSAKQSATKTSRIIKATPQILNGEGPHDGYKAKRK